MINSFLTLSTPFPVEHRLVYVWPALNWPRHGEDPDLIGPELGRCVDFILACHPDVRGLIHSVSYSRSKQLERFCRSPRLILHTEKEGDFDRALQTLFATPGGVLVSPRATEGVDLKGDRSEFQVFIKIPFLFWGDERVQQRARVNKTWYALTAATNLIQGCGRSVRNMHDIAPTYVLDAKWGWWFRANENLFPPYFKDALAAAERHPAGVRLQPCSSPSYAKFKEHP
jgi:Rad3-related DNA helicase